MCPRTIEIVQIDTVVAMSADQANGAIFELDQRLKSQMASRQMETHTRFQRLEARDLINVTVVPSGEKDTSGTLRPVTSRGRVQHLKSSSVFVIRSLERDTPMLTDGNFSDWVEHATAYWGHHKP